MIKKVIWKQDSSLSGFELDLTKSDGSTYNTVIFVGENGVGKTRILDSLSDFLNCKDSFEFDYFEYVLNEKIYYLKPNPSSTFPHMHNRYLNGEEVKSKIYYWKNNDYNQIKNDSEDIRSYGCAYSKARTGFKTDPIDKSTNKSLDDDRHMPDDNYDYTSVKQTLIDVGIQDDAEWMELSKAKTEITIDEFLEKSRLSRFSKAFNSFFDNLKFKSIDVHDTKKYVLFEKNGKTVDIERLSTGEKQIVFRGSYLLSNSRNLRNGIILIDEPELSMHPKWQSKILDFYRNLFSENGCQIAQIFIATHSDYVLKSALNDPDNVKVVLLQTQDDRTVVGPIKDKVLPSLDSAEIDYLIFGISSVEYHIVLFGYYQQLIEKRTIDDVNKCIHDSKVYDLKYDKKGRNQKIESLPVYVRNFIDHPEEKIREVDEKMMEQSIGFLRDLIMEVKNTNM